jgi:hypothetical protein
MFYNDLWEFPSIPLIFGYNSTEQENPIMRIFTFQGPSRTKLTWDFSGINILPREAPGAQEFNEGATRAKRAKVAQAPAFIASSLHCRPSSSPNAQLDPKMPI